LIQKLLAELDRVALHAMRLAVKPISGRQVSYEAGRRIGYFEGITATRKQLEDFLAGNAKQDDDL